MMSQDLICSWLGLAQDAWPPDHYTLLGLSQDETNTERIEEQVQTRLELVRRYQLLHPEQVTEAMNRLAQAYVCLTDPVAKRAYDRELTGGPDEEPVPAEREAEDPLSWLVGSGSRQFAEAGSGPPASVALLDWATVPPPQHSVALMEIPAIRDEMAEEFNPAPAARGGLAPTVNAMTLRPEALGAIPEVPLVAAPPPAQTNPVRMDPVVEAARASAPARRGLGTKLGLYQRIASTRKLLDAWVIAGKYMGNPKRRLARPSEATELIRGLGAIRTLIQHFPPLIGEAGQPGYAVVALAKQSAPVPTFQTLLPSQRATLAQHWQTGQQLLEEHKAFLRQELRTLRKKSTLGRAWRATRATLTDQPIALLLLLGLLVVNIVIWRLYVPLR